ncbi:MAG: hypothetical protein M3Y08_00485 [Fibrobacterota bacterium]|nr:hypothetical protein [Fibrobacterota bacterium]
MTERKNVKQDGDEKQMPGSGDWSGLSRRNEPESSALNRILSGFPFPASKEEIARQLAIEAFTHGGGRAADLHDLVVNLDHHEFGSLEALHRAIKDRHAWEKTHDTMA